MSKILLLSSLLVSMWLPIRAAKDNNSRRGLRRTITGMVLFNIFYVFALLYIYPRLQ